ncbi:MAG TPA: transporter [Rhizobium sp.]|nr:transporter [Rhizobium sp.]
MRATWLAVPVLSTVEQLFVKLGAESAVGTNGGGFVEAILSSPWFMAAIAIEIGCFFIWMTVLSELDLSKAFPLSALSYILIMAVAFLVFGEPVQPLNMIATLLILAGLWCIATASRNKKQPS